MVYSSFSFSFFCISHEPADPFGPSLANHDVAWKLKVEGVLNKADVWTVWNALYAL